MQVLPALIIWIVLVVSIGLTLRQPLREIHRLRRAARVPIGLLPPTGIVEVSGQASGTDLQSPLTDTPCIFWQVEVEAYYTVLLRGRLPAIVLLVGLAVAIVLEQRILHWASARDRLFPAIPLSALLGEIRWPWNWLGLYHPQAGHEYLRQRRAAYYTLWIWQRGQADSEGGAEMAATLFTLSITCCSGRTLPYP
jgi:hypothetical protein